MSDKSAKKSLTSEQLLRKLKKLEQSESRKIVQFLSNSLKLTDKLINYIFARQTKRYTNDEVLIAARPPIIFGLWVLIVTFGFFGLWAFLAPLNSASIASGTVVVASKTKVIQHLEGGIIEKVFVREGDKVEEGNPLLKLNEMNIKSSLFFTTRQLESLLAAESRLLAERDNLPAIKFNIKLLVKASDLEVRRIMDTQQRLFHSRKEIIENKLQVLEHQIKQIHAQSAATETQMKFAKKQLLITKEQLSGAEKLYAQGNMNKTNLFKAQSSFAQAQAHVGELEAKIAQAYQKINEAKVGLINTKSTQLNEIVHDLYKVQLDIVNVSGQVKVLKEKLARVLIKAPQSGIIKHLTPAAYTVGGVISPGHNIMEIVPTDDKLIIEAKVNIQDIDRIAIGQIAKIRVFAYKSRIVPMLLGRVDDISPDSFEDRNGQNGHRPYYLAKVSLDEEQYIKRPKLKEVKLYPGMRADVLIVTGSRTFLRYLIDPFVDTIRKSFKER